MGVRSREPERIMFVSVGDDAYERGDRLVDEGRDDEAATAYREALAKGDDAYYDLALALSRVE
jgi:predicted negative regulator of RcsB-dependent stress response